MAEGRGRDDVNTLRRGPARVNRIASQASRQENRGVGSKNINPLTRSRFLERIADRCMTGEMGTVRRDGAKQKE